MRRYEGIERRFEGESAIEFLLHLCSELTDFVLSVFVVFDEFVNNVLNSFLLADDGIGFRIYGWLEGIRPFFLSYHFAVLNLFLHHLLQS